MEALRESIRRVIIVRSEEILAQMSSAVAQGDVETIRALLARGMDINTASYE